MAKRFTDTNKWNDEWFCELDNQEKLVWLFILDSCDHAGIWKKNLRLLNFQIGSTFVEDDLRTIFAGKFIEVNDKWFIPNFIKFQYGKTFLTSKTAAVVSARELLIDLGVVQQDSNGSLTLTKELPNPYLRIKDKDKDKEEDINKNECINKVQEQEWNILVDKANQFGWNSLSVPEAARWHELKLIYG
jgi:hypothetical protein